MYLLWDQSLHTYGGMSYIAFVNYVNFFFSRKVLRLIPLNRTGGYGPGSPQDLGRRSPTFRQLIREGRSGYTPNYTVTRSSSLPAASLHGFTKRLCVDFLKKSLC